MRKQLHPAHLLILSVLMFTVPAAPAVADETTVAPTDTVPMTLTPEEITSLQDAADAGSTDSGDTSFFNDASGFISDNAPYLIIGIIVLAAILAGVLIMRGRRKARSGGTASAAAAGVVASKAAGAPASVPSATELRRRKRAAMQRAREEERLRRRASKTGNGAPAASHRAAAPSAALNPVEAEKQAARDQASAAGAVARTGTTIAAPGTGAIPAPVSPSQTAPALGVVTSVPSPAAGSAQPPSAVTPEAQPGMTPVTSAEPPTAVNPPPPTDGEEIFAPGPDAAVGRAAAAFAAGAAGGAIASKATSPKPEDPLEAKVAEIKAAQEGPPQAVPGSVVPPAPGAEPSQIVPERPDPSQPAPPVISGLSAVERQLSADRIERDRALKEAEERLREIERRAEDAERRAAFAERLAQLKLEESERERRLDEVISGIDRAEERALEAEQRAEAAERAAASALESGSISRGPVSQLPDQAPGQTFPSKSRSGPATPDPAVAADSPVPPAAPSRPGPEGPGELNLNTATFEELREAELSVTQATRILAYRERFGGYAAIEDLSKVPGFPADAIESLRGRFTV